MKLVQIGKMTYRYRSATYKIIVQMDGNLTKPEVELDGHLLADAVIPLASDGLAHHVTVRTPQRAPERPNSHGYPNADRGSSELLPIPIDNGSHSASHLLNPL